MRINGSKTHIRSGLRVLTATMLAGWIGMLQAPAAIAATPEAAFVQQNIDKGYAILNDTSLAPQQRTDRFRDFLSQIMDTKRIAAFELGPYVRTSSNGDVAKFADALGDLIASLFQHDLAGNPGETLAVTGSVVRGPDDVFVTTILTGSPHSNGQPVNISFRVRKDATGAPSVVDVQFEGVSMAISQRRDFDDWLQRRHGDVAALATDLHARARKMRDDESTVKIRRAGT
jgi:phospholipid transport system substrate-binding protein